MLCYFGRHRRCRGPKNSIISTTECLMRTNKIINGQCDRKFDTKPSYVTGECQRLTREVRIPHAPVETRPFLVNDMGTLPVIESNNQYSLEHTLASISRDLSRRHAGNLIGRFRVLRNVYLRNISHVFGRTLSVSTVFTFSHMDMHHLTVPATMGSGTADPCPGTHTSCARGM